MTTQKQIEANQQNALLSTGAKTEAGKATVSKNAITHGIFTKELIINANGFQESLEEYNDLLNNLITELAPQGQFQQFLVEKIAVDIWRLKRVFRFENGNISIYIKQLRDAYYEKTDDYGMQVRSNNYTLDKEMKENTNAIAWNNHYIHALKQNEVTFEADAWKNGRVEVEFVDDFLEIIEKYLYDDLTSNEQRNFDNDSLDFKQIKNIFSRLKMTHENVRDFLIQLYVNKNEELMRKNAGCELRRRDNLYFESVTAKACAIPSHDNSEKAIRYEQALQKSIYQNFILLKKLQGGEIGFVL
jgi:hypothetical protein